MLFRLMPFQLHEACLQRRCRVKHTLREIYHRLRNLVIVKTHYIFTKVMKSL